ncbi:MAG TPA: substrate-binding domain-containing protein [Ramlibacter sp.]|nr:substrate-binding domain-containing protein [Ramlibacter sp.]
MKKLHILSGGAAQGLVGQLRERFEAQHGYSIEGTFGAVGLMRDKLLASEPCDVMILTGEMISGLASKGQIVANTARALGIVKTGVAIKAGAPKPDVSTPKALEALLRRSSGIYFPDPEKATAGIHFMKVLRMLGLDQDMAASLRPFPTGVAAMREMAGAPADDVVGCTQVTEILYTPGVQLAGLLPRKYELSTMYTAAVCSRASEPQAAAALIAMLAGEDAKVMREAGGFERA